MSLDEELGILAVVTPGARKSKNAIKTLEVDACTCDLCEEVGRDLVVLCPEMFELKSDWRRSGYDSRWL